MKVLVRDLRIDGVTIHRDQQKDSSIAIALGKDDDRRSKKVKALRCGNEVVIEIFGTFGCHYFDYIQTLEKVLDEVESFGKAPWVKTIVILDDIITPEGYDRMKMLFPEFELKEEGKNITIVSSRQYPIVWTTKSIRESMLSNVTTTTSASAA